MSTLSHQISLVSERLNLPNSTVTTVINSYSKYVKFMAHHYAETTYLGILTLKNKDPEPLPKYASAQGIDGTSISSARTTYGYQALTLSRELKMSYATVKSILDDYRELLVAGIAEGRAFTLYRVGVVKPSSTSFNLRSSSEFPSSVRIHSTRWFRELITNIKKARNAG